MKYCKYCGNSIDSNSIFCDKCGGDLRIGAGANDDISANTTENPVKSAPLSNVRTGGDWCKLMYMAFAVWGLSFILLFLDWFTIDLSLGGYGDYSMGFNLFTMSSALKKIDYYTDALIIIDALLIVFVFFLVIFTATAIRRFLKRHYKMFSAGITISVLFFALSFVPVVVLQTLIKKSGDEDMAVGIIIDNILNTTAAPYIIMVINIAAFVMMLFAKRGYIDEFGAPNKVKIKIMKARLYADDLLCSECGKFNSSTSEYCVFCGSERLTSQGIKSEPSGSGKHLTCDECENFDSPDLRKSKRQTSQKGDSELLESGNYLICAECECINSPDARECFYCGAELYIPDNM